MLNPNVGPQSKLPLKRTLDYLKGHKLCAVPAECGFAVLPHDLLCRKGSGSVLCMFNRKDSVSLRKVRNEANKLVTRLEMSSVSRKMGGARKDSLELFFSARTHKVALFASLFLKKVVGEKR